MSIRTRSKTLSPAHIGIAALLLGVLFAQAASAIPRLSITFDEDLHITTGYHTLRTGTLELIEDHPPLVGLWMGWPLLLSPEVPNPEDVPDWAAADRRLFVRNEVWWGIDIDSWVIPARFTVPWLTLLLGAFLFRWATEWFGPRAGLFALALLAFDPNILAHSTLATLDLGVTTFIFISLYGVQRFIRRPCWKNILFAGIVLGLALAAKISAVLLLPISTGIIFLWGVRRWQTKDLILKLGGYLAVAFLALWATHLFQVGTAGGILPLPLPAPTYLRSFLRVGRHVMVGNRSYLLGETYTGGRWAYFPVVFAFKTPLPTLLLLGFASVAAWRKRQSLWRLLLSLSFPTIYVAISIVNEINLGYRHILPILPFLYLFAAQVAGRLLRRRLLAKNLLLALLLAWQAAGTLAVAPNHLTFANAIAGGPENAYRTMADSNVDWGQALKAVRDYLETHDIDDARLSHYVFFIRPELYGVDATPLPPLLDAPAVMPARFNPDSGTYIISASTLRGLKLADPENYDWFTHREPDALIANAMLVYEVAPRDPAPRWLAQCSVPITPLSPVAAAEGFGRDDLRHAAFDCTQSWLYPGGGTSPGWFAIHQDALAPDDPFIQQRLGLAHLSFEQEIPQETPPLAIFDWEGGGIAPQEQHAAHAAPVEWPPQQAQSEGASLSPPIQTDGPLAFLGYEIIDEAGAISLLTTWRVTQPPDRPFSIMAHLVDETGYPVAVGDGLGVPWTELQTGDVIVQRHVLPLPAEGAAWLQTGAYWLEDPPVRFAFLAAGEPVGDRLLLSAVESR